MRISGTKILITGGNGFIGSHLKKRLKTLGAKVIVPTSDKLDVTNELEVFLSIKVNKPKVIFHLAASLNKDITDFHNTFNTNVIGTLNILKNANKHNVKKVILMDSFEDSNKFSGYGLSKKITSELGAFYYLNSGLEVTRIKPTIVYGPGQDNNMFIPSMMKALVNKKVFKMSEGKQKRDFVYISDLIKALIKTITTSDSQGEIIEIGSGRAVKIIDLPKYLKYVTADRFEFETKKDKMRLGEPKKIEANLNNAKKILGFEPNIEIEEGIWKTMDWWEKNDKRN